MGDTMFNRSGLYIPRRLENSQSVKRVNAFTNKYIRFRNQLGGKLREIIEQSTG